MCWIHPAYVFCVCAIVASGCGDGDAADGGPSSDAGGSDAGDFDAGDFDAGDFDAGPMGVDAGDLCDLSFPTLAAEDVGSPGGGWRQPVFLTYAPGSDDLYVVEQAGRVRRIASDGSVSEFFDIGARTGFRDERGLLGLAFHPEYQANGRFFVYFTPADGGPYDSHNHVGEFRREDAGLDDPPEVRSIVTIDDPDSNHNGGMIAFGPDGFLYVAMGDGGGSGDRHGPIGNGLDRDTILGKLLRLDVDNEGGMFVAAGNPFVGGEGDDRIWAYGLRNPWRFSFDRLTGDLYIADVGQDAFEEINFQPASSSGGENYGWRAYEGLEVFNAANVSEVPVHAEPVFVYPRSGGPVINGRAVTGGYVYRGAAIPGLSGWYLFADYISGDVAAFKICDGSVMGARAVPELSGGGSISSFGEDRAGELYLVGFDFVRRIVGG